VEAAVAAHRDTLSGRSVPQIRSDSPEVVTRWVDERVTFHFQLPAAQPASAAQFQYQLAGARLVEWKGTHGVIIFYSQGGQVVSLFIASSLTAVIAGGDEVRNGKLLFHYRTQEGFNVITWYNHGLSYALVSSVSGPARHACLICHGTLPASPQR
jgi:hypothetical protein